MYIYVYWVSWSKDKDSDKELYDQCSIRWYTGTWNVYTLHVFVSATSKQLGEIVYMQWMSTSGSTVVVSREEISPTTDRVSDRVNITGTISWSVSGELKEDATFRMYGPGWRQISSTDVQEVKWSLWCNQKWAGIDCLRWVFGTFTGSKQSVTAVYPGSDQWIFLETRLILAPVSPGGVLWWCFYRWVIFFFLPQPRSCDYQAHLNHVFGTSD